MTERRLSNPWVVLAMLLAIYIFNFADRYLITGLVGPIKAEFGIDDGMIGLLMGPAFVLIYVMLGIPIARLADRASRIRIIAAGCVMWSLATIATGFASGPVTLTLARVGVGVGEAAFVAPAYSLLADYFRPERRGLAFAILGLATYFGQILGQGGGPAIAAAHHWRMAFWTMGLPGLVLGVLALAVVREPPRSAGGEAPAIAFAHLLRRLGGARAYLMMAAAFALGALSGVSFGYWGPELLTRSHALDPVMLKSAFALNFGLAGLVGMLLFGAISDRLARRSMVWPVRLSALSLGAATVCIICATWAPSFATAMLWAIPSGLLGGGWSVGMMATLQYILPQRFRASATALFIAATTLGGYLIGPWLTGALSSGLGDDAASLRAALTIVMPAGLLGALLAWLAADRVEHDRTMLARGEPD